MHRLVLVMGPSGAGRSTALAALEDAGFEPIDNMPLSLIPRLVEGPPPARPVALGIDVRNREFATAALLDLVARLRRAPGIAPELLFLDCAPDVLVRRYASTRRRHPLAPAETPEIGIAREADLLAPVRAAADHLIDTSDLTPHDLRAELARRFAPGGAPALAVAVQSFSYKRGVPAGIDMMFDCRFLRNPYWEAGLRDLDGRDPRVVAFIAADPLFAPFFERLAGLIELVLPAQVAEGKAHLAIALGCTGGQHRSVTIAEKLAERLAAGGWRISIRHRELERRMAPPPPPVKGDGR